MNTEDYVNFEISASLKQKGFNWGCISYYEHFSSNVTLYSGMVPEWSNSYIDHNKIDGRYSHPTLQMAMKWLREAHNVFISVNIGNHKKDNRDTSMPDFVYYFFYITDTKAVYEEEKQCHKEFATFKETCEAAIRYCLENLI